MVLESDDFIKIHVMIYEITTQIFDEKFEQFEAKFNRKFMDLQELMLQLIERFDKEFTVVTIAKIDEHDNNIKKLDTRVTKLELASK